MKKIILDNNQFNKVEKIKKIFKKIEDQTDVLIKERIRVDPFRDFVKEEKLNSNIRIKQAENIVNDI